MGSDRCARVSPGVTEEAGGGATADRGPAPGQEEALPGDHGLLQHRAEEGEAWGHLALGTDTEST